MVMVMVMRLLNREVPCQAGVLGTSAMQYDNQSTAGNIFRCTERILDGYEDIWNPLLCIADRWHPPNLSKVHNVLLPTDILHLRIIMTCWSCWIDVRSQDQTKYTLTNGMM